MWNIVQKFIVVLEYEINYYSVSCIQFAPLLIGAKLFKRVDSTIHRIISIQWMVQFIGLTNTYPLDRDLSGG